MQFILIIYAVVCSTSLMNIDAKRDSRYFFSSIDEASFIIRFNYQLDRCIIEEDCYLLKITKMLDIQIHFDRSDSSNS